MLYRAEAVVLRTQEFGERDKILTLYSRQHGKIKAIAKGVKRPGSSLSPAAQPFTYGVYSLASGKSLDVVREARVKEPFPAIRQNALRLANASLVAELTDLGTPEGEPNPDLFDFLLFALYGIDRREPSLSSLCFLAGFLYLMGLWPSLSRCARCSHPLALHPSQVPFSPSGGGVLCPSCRAQDSFPLRREAVFLMEFLGRKAREIQRFGDVEVKSLPPSEFDASSCFEAEKAFLSILERHAEICPKSIKVLRGIRKGKHWGGEEVRGK